MERAFFANFIFGRRKERLQRHVLGGESKVATDRFVKVIVKRFRPLYAAIKKHLSPLPKIRIESFGRKYFFCIFFAGEDVSYESFAILRRIFYHKLNTA